MNQFKVGFPSSFGGTATRWRWTGAGEITIGPAETRIDGRRSRPFWLSGPQSVTFLNEQVRDVQQAGNVVTCRVHLEGRTPEPLTLRAESEEQAQKIAQLWPTQQSQEFVEHAAFAAQLADAGTRTRVTYALIGACVLMFLLPALGGVSILEPDGAAMVRWGTNYGPLTLSGQAWRLFSALFLHFGIVHLLLNMWALLSLGPLVERLLGSVRFALLYVLAGLGGSIASVAWNADVNSAGASGAIFGVMGALLALMLNPRTRIPPAVANAQRNSALIFIAYNVFNGLAHQGIDNAAHLGGLVSGFALGWVLAVPVGTRPATIDRTLMMATVAALAVLGGAFTLLQHPGAEELERRHLVAALQPFFDAEGKAVDLMSKLADELKAGQITNQAAAARIQVEVKPLWENALATVSAATSQATGARREAADAVQRYCEARLRHAGLTADALRQEQAELNSRAAEAAQQVNGLADKAREALKVLNP